METALTTPKNESDLTKLNLIDEKDLFIENQLKEIKRLDLLSIQLIKKFNRKKTRLLKFMSTERFEFLMAEGIKG